MPNKFELTNPSSSSRGTYLQKALWQGQMSFGILLFSYAVQLFKAKPTKKKAIFIWNKFLKTSFENEKKAGQGGFVGFDEPEIDWTDLSIELPAGSLKETKFWIDAAVRVSQDAAQMNRLVRFLTSNDRAVPPHIFDDPFVAMRDKSGDNPLNEMVNTLDGLSGHRSKGIADNFKEHNFLPTIKKQVKDAGFDLGDIGLNSVSV